MHLTGHDPAVWRDDYLILLAHFYCMRLQWFIFLPGFFFFPFLLVSLFFGGPLHIEWGYFHIPSCYTQFHS